MVTFFGLVLIVPGWTLFSADPSDLTNPHFSTSSGTLLWILLGNPHTIDVLHHYGVGIIVIGITIVVVGLFTTPKEKDTTLSFNQ